VIRWLEDNPAGVALAAVAGVLLLISLLLGVLWSLPPSAPAGSMDGGENAQQLEVPKLPDNEPIERFAVITERPAFNQSRQPELPLELDEEEPEEAPGEDVDAPEVQLTGVIITPSLRMVTLKQKDAAESLVAFENQPLEGNYGSWHVSRIEPREITLSSGSGEELQLKLQVHDVAIAAPPKIEKDEEQDEASSRPGARETRRDADQPLTRAEEIRQRIAERREELRQAAESAEAEDTVEAAAREPAKPVNYQQKIRSMIQGGQEKAPGEDENDQ